MSEIFQIHIAHTIIKNSLHETTGTKEFMQFSEKAIASINRMLEAHNLTASNFLSEINASLGREGKFPWLTILYPQDYPIGVFLREHREKARDPLYNNYWRYKEKIPDLESRKFLSQLFFFSKSTLADYAPKAAFLGPVWEIFCGKDTFQHWLFLAEEISQKDVDDMRTDVLYQRGF